MWAGLGYYSRGKRLHEGAQKVRSLHLLYQTCLEFAHYGLMLSQFITFLVVGGVGA